MKNRIAILMVVSIVLVMALSACGLVDDIATVNDLGKSLMTAMRDGDASGSWNMLTVDVMNGKFQASTLPLKNNIFVYYDQSGAQEKLDSLYLIKGLIGFYK
jgi:major membrane immunogen (membrane-anchored lipoprotein)